MFVVAITACSCSPNSKQEQEPVTPVNPVNPINPVPEDPTVKSKEYKLHNWYADLDTGLPKIELTENNYSSATFPVPKRNHFTFNGWYIDNDKVADENGNSLMTEEIFNSDNTDITAKFTADEAYTYKILLVFVTQIDAELPTCDQSATIHVDYSMSDAEKEFHTLSVMYLKDLMYKMLDGLVDFQIDGYFTTEPAITEYFIQSPYAENKIFNSLFPDDIPEVQDMLPNYDTVISVYSMDDFTYKLHNGAGAAIAKYGEVNFDSHLKVLSLNNDKYEILQDLANYNEILKDTTIQEYYSNKFMYLWLDTITHETAHTIELRISLYDFDSAAVSYLGNVQKINYLEAQKYYYLNIAVKNNSYIGIPYEFWKGVATAVYLSPYDSLGYFGGIITSKNYGTYIPIGSANRLFEVVYGGEITVTAIPLKGYIFVRWSDGITTPTRTDFITGNIEVTAIFEKIE